MEQLGERSGLAVDGDRTEGKFEFEAEFSAGDSCDWFSASTSFCGALRQDVPRLVRTLVSVSRF